MAGARIQLKRATAAAWAAANTVLYSGEIGLETDTNKFKIGNGSTAFNSLSYFNGNLSGSSLNDLADVTITSATDGDFLRWNGTAWINDAVNLSTDTIGSYVASLVAGTGVTLTNNSGEGATPTVTVDTSVIQARVTNVTDTEIGYLDGVSSAIQTQLDAKAPLASPTFTGTVTVPTPTSNTDASTKAYVDSTASTTASNASTALTNHEADTTSIHGIADTSILVTTTGSQTLTNKTITSPSGLVKGDVGLGSVDNTADTAKPVSTAQQTALDLKSNIASPTFTGTVTIPTGASITAPTGLVKGDVGLGNVDNTSDSNKPVSTATQTALDLKAPLASPTFTGTVVLPDNTVALGTKTTGDYVSSLVAGTGVTLSNNSGETATPTIAIGQAVATNSNVTFNDLIVSGNLTVSGTTTSINTETLTIDDNIIVLNNNATGAPSQNAGLEVERGSSTNVLLRWDESSDKWQITNDGSTYGDIATTADLAAASIAELDDIGDVTAPTPTSGDFLKWNGTAWINASGVVTTADTGTVTSTMIADATIVNGDINASAAIAYSKLANITAGSVLLGNASNIPTVTALSGDVTVDSTGVTAIGSGVVVNADISASAAIELSKLATSTAGNILVYNASGVPTAVTETGDVTISDTGVTAIASGVVVNADISATAAIDLGKLADVSTSAQTASYTLVLTDKNKIVEMGVGSANNLTVPPNSSVAFPVGSQINILQTNTGQTTIVAGAGVTVNATPGLKIRAQWSSATLIKRATDTWVLIGDLSS
jgi:hypothetical protein